MIQARSQLRNLLAPETNSTHQRIQIQSSCFQSSQDKYSTNDFIRHSSSMNLNNLHSSIGSNYSMKSNKSFSSQTKSKLQSSCIINKLKSNRINDCFFKLKQKCQTKQDYQYRIQKLKQRANNLETKLNKAKSQKVQKCRRIRKQLLQYFNNQ